LKPEITLAAQAKQEASQQIKKKVYQVSACRVWDFTLPLNLNKKPETIGPEDHLLIEELVAQFLNNDCKLPAELAQLNNDESTHTEMVVPLLPDPTFAREHPELFVLADRRDQPQNPPIPILNTKKKPLLDFIAKRGCLPIFR
jgi:hypothetical protein